ncbi:MAG TPA: metallophosphoesterase [Phycisphaerae bacterium]|nr:metallophosphoesterase [Phycisphaerae bacterium]
MSFAVTAWLIVSVNFAVAILVLLRPWRKPADPAQPAPITFVDAVRAALAATALLVLERLAGIGRNPFALIHLVYLHLVVLAPATGLTVLALSLWRKGGRRAFAVSLPVKILAVLTLLVAPIGVYATFIEPFRLTLETVRVPLREGRDAGSEIRVAVLADIQTDRVGEHEHRAIDLAMAQTPDIILLPGDLWQSEHEPTPKDTAALRELLNRLSAPGGVWFSPGNCDSPAWTKNLLAGTPVTLLDNDIVQVQVRGRRVTIGGVELYNTREAEALIRQLEEDPTSGDVRILMGHLPDNVLHLRPNSRIDLVVAGHTHGGQIVIPGLGPPMTLSRVPRHIGAGGLHHLNGNAIYVSRGVGCERRKAPRIRFFCPPEVSLLTIESTAGPAASQPNREGYGNSL